ncbi:MAG TPA: AarF/UbiB family protein [Jatrophihabitans sp.]|nr:AarF/UbiB family protein [Jatrophihabitans sp.]
MVAALVTPARRVGVGSTAMATPGRIQVAVRAVRLLILILAWVPPTALAGLGLVLLKGRAAAARHVWRQLTILLERLGPAFVKAGQVVATRRDLLPGVACDQLSALQESSSPMSTTQARRALENAFGTRLDEIFERVDFGAVATGSVACVYRARLSTGGDVALKLRRPGIETSMALDLRLIRAGASWVAKLPPMRGIPVIPVVEHACAAVFGQLDFDREAESLCLLRENLATVPRVWVPKVRKDLSVRSCIVMEFLDGLELDVAQRCSVATRRRFAASALTAIYHMLFVDGFVHCDMHPGNLYFTESGHVVVLDAGFSVRLTDRLRRLFADFFLNMALGQGIRCAQIVIESAEEAGPGADIDGFTVRMADLVERNHRVPAKEFSLMRFATEMFDLQRRHGVHAAPELIFPLLSLLVIEGTIRDLDPDVDFQEVARPMLMQGTFARR